MPGYLDVQNLLERLLGTYPMPMHNYFWRDRTRDELLSSDLVGASLLKPGRPDESNLLLAMRASGRRADEGKRAEVPWLYEVFKEVNVRDEDTRVLETWIRAGCPETTSAELAAVATAESVTVDDNAHVRYWTAIDLFFLPSLASPVTRPHVLRVHGFDTAWGPTVVAGGNVALWTAFLAQPLNAASFDYVRLHQRRVIREFYGESKDNLLDSMWKFGGNLLPKNPNHPDGKDFHTMNSVRDWFWWSPYLDATLRAPDVDAVDLNLVRGWQIGLVADGLLSNYMARAGGQRMPIPDFDANDPDLRSKVFAKYADADATVLISEMVRRARDTSFFPAPPIS